MKKNEYGLEPIQNAVLDIYKEVAKICAAHGLRHYAAYGTCLGAVRHSGFIPWDDDFDIMMPRPDYEKFFKIADSELPPHLRTITLDNTKEYGLTFNKVQDCRVDFLRDVECRAGQKLPQGLFVDVFPLDGVISNSFWKAMRRLHSLLFYVRRKYVLGEGEYKSYSAKMGGLCAICAASLFRGLLTARDFAAYQAELLRKPEYEKSRFVAWCRTECFDSYLNRALPKTYLGSPKMLPFEDVSIPVPEDFDKYLTLLYSDYMAFPPEEERHPKHEICSIAPWLAGPTGL